MAATEREYIIPLRRGFVKAPRYQRSKKAITVLRNFLERHLKADEIKIGQHLNETVWARGIRNPPGKVAVKAIIDEVDGKNVAKVELLGKTFKESVKPLAKEEEQGGIAGKLKGALGGKDKTAKAEPEKKTATPTNATPAKQEHAEKPVEKPAKEGSKKNA